MPSAIGSAVLADVDSELPPAAAAPAKRSDLRVRTLSALVMLAVAGGCLAAGGLWLKAFVAVVALVGFAEAVALILKATGSQAWRVGGIVAALVYIGAAASALLSMPRAVMIVTIVTVIATDTGAYFTGRTFGGPRIVPSISPSKTWSGLLGGMTAAAIWLALSGSVIGFAVAHLSGSAPDVLDARFPLLGALAGAVLAIAAQAGDFLESWLKRRAGAKDSSRLIPGHGGVLDRADGILPVAIIMGMIGW